jgi:UDP-N-acetylglucosamine--N-acetylmuramyl-(pentapeptide) pyrophosphoryl-undecaprenol N-acetylglucosamine transferase
MTTAMKPNKPHRFILSGGGTGGHIFPAVAIAKSLQQRYPDAEFLFVGALGKMEMEKVPKEGFKIVGLPIEGLKRSLSPRNLLVAMKTLQSFWKAKKILNQFQPSAVIGTGGYASLPICFMAARNGYPTILQEQNGFAGLTNRMVARNAKHICTGFPNMDAFFPEGKWTFTGNPVRQNIIDLGTRLGREGDTSRADSLSKFGNLKPHLPVLLVTGGSLGARTINQTLFNNLLKLAEAKIQVIWQMGLPFSQSHTEKINEIITSNPSVFSQGDAPGIFIAPFIYNMEDAFAAADVVISRAGAISISEIAVVGKPSVLVPSPNVTDDHQTKNARVLSDMDAAVLITDQEAPEKLIDAAIALLKDTKKQAEMQEKLNSIAKPQATETIVNLIESCLQKGA